MPKRIQGRLYYQGEEIEAQVKLVIVDVLMELQGLILKKTLEHPKLFNLTCKPKRDNEGPTK